MSMYTDLLQALLGLGRLGHLLLGDYPGEVGHAEDPEILMLQLTQAVL